MNTATSGLESLSGLDGTFLNLETLATPMHVGSLHLFEVPEGYQGDFEGSVRTMMAQRLVPVLRRRLAAMPLHMANPIWLQGDVDLGRHIERIHIPAPGDWAQLQAVVANLHAELLDRTRPLWMLYMLEGLTSGEKAYYFKIHHAMLDGQAGAALAAALFDISANPASSPDRAPISSRVDRKPSALSLVAAAFRHDATQYVKLVRDLPGVVRTLTGLVRSSGGASRASPPNGGSKPHTRKISEKGGMAFGPRTPLNVTITRDRAFAAATVSLAEVKAMATVCEATVNDIVLALCGGALRRYLARLGALPKKSLIASMPISLRVKGDTDFHTKATLSLVSLATTISNPIKRLQAVRSHASATKAVAKKAKSVIPTDFPSIGVPWLVGTLASLYGRSGISNAIPPLANVLISNVPGPAVPLYVGGLRMTGYWPLSIVEHGVGLNITLMSYAGKLCLGLTAARCAVPDVQLLADDFMSAFEEMRDCTIAKPLKLSKAPKPVKPKNTKAKPVLP